MLTRGGTPKWRLAVRSLTTFIVVLVGGTAIVRLVQSTFSSSHASPEAAGAPEELVSEQVTLKRGEAKRYDLVLNVRAHLKIELRADPVPVSVKLISTQNLVPMGASPKRPSTGSEPVFTQADSRRMIRVEALEAGKWTILIERLPKSATRDKRDTTITTNVTVQ